METPQKTTNKKDTLGKSSDHLPHHRSHHPSRSAIVAELAEVDALPRAEVQSAIGDGNG